MATLAELAAALLGGENEKALEAENPYLRMANTANQISEIPIALVSKEPTRYSYSDMIPLALGTGLANGILSGLGENYQSVLSDRYRNAMLTAAMGQEPINDGLSSKLFSQAKNQGQAFALQRMMNLEDETRKQKTDLTKTFFESLAKAQTPQDAERITNMASAFGIVPKSLTEKRPRPEAEPVAEPMAGYVDFGPDFGIPTVQDVEKQMFQENLKAGMPKTQAATSAKASAEELRKRSKDLLGDTLKNEIESIDNAESIIRKGEEGITKAGTTGSWLGSKYEKGLSVASDILGGGVFSEAEAQAAGDSLLSQTQQLGAMLNRIKGSGALSDMESRALFETAMSPSKSNSQNREILEQYRNGLAILREHQGFLSYYINKTGSSPELAQTLWDLYKQDNPILVQDASGGYTLNKDRTPWQKFDFKNAYRSFLSGEPLNVAKGEADAPPAGYEFTGTIDSQGRRGIRKK